MPPKLTWFASPRGGVSPLGAARRGLRGEKLKQAVVLSALAFFTAFAAGPFLWVAMMSLRTTSEISRDHYRLPETLHWETFPDAWFNSNYGVYFTNSLLVVISAVVILTLVGAMAAHCFARYRFRLNRGFYFIIFSTIIFPPQITIIALFQTLVQYDLFYTLIGLTTVLIEIARGRGGGEASPGVGGWR